VSSRLPLRARTRATPGQKAAAVQRWRAAIYVSLVLWVAMAVGNVALFMVRPARHWPVLEAVEAFQVASLIPIALLLHRQNRRSSASRVLTLGGILAMTTAVLIDLGFVTERVAFGVGPLGGPLFVADFVLVLVWLLAANTLAWRARTLPPRTAVLGIATALTATLLYPAWARQLARALANREPDRGRAPATSTK